jgi:hypothetical protein
VPGPRNSEFDVKIYVDANNEKVGAYQFELSYDQNRLVLDPHRGVSAGSDGFITASNTRVPGHVTVNGFNAEGYQGEKEMHLVTIHFNGQENDADSIRVIIDDLANEKGNAIGR